MRDEVSCPFGMHNDTTWYLGTKSYQWVKEISLPALWRYHCVAVLREFLIILVAAFQGTMEGMQCSILFIGMIPM